MEIINPLKMNNWEINPFLSFIFIIQSLVLLFLLTDGVGLHIPVLSEVVSLIYLLFIPGILIIRIMKMHNLSSVEVLLYSVGLSIVSIMFIGFFINLIYPLIGINNPISTLPLIITTTIYVVLLSFLSYMRDRNFSSPDFISSEDLLSPYLLFLLLIPFLSIYATYLVNWYGINILIIVLLAVISSIVLLFAYNKIPSKQYPLTIFILSISLLFHTSLISNYITGYDIQAEYYMANLVIKNAYWNLNLSSVLNTTLSIVIYAPVISIISKINLDLIFKIIYPFIFSLVPLSLYIIIKKQTNKQIAFLSSFLFISFIVFFTEMLALARQEIAEFFLVLLVLVMITSKFRNINRSLLFIIFGISLTLSHYGLSYIYMFSFLTVYIILLLNERYNLGKLYNSVFDKITGFLKERDLERFKIVSLASIFRNENDVEEKNIPINRYKILSFNFVLIFMIFAFSWFMYTSSSSSLNIFVKLGNNIAGAITTEFLNSASVQSLSIIQTATTPLHSIFRNISYLTQFFIIIGFFSILLKDKMKFKNEYLVFIFVNILIIIGAVTVPYLSGAFEAERLYQITLIFLAPVCVIGGLTLIKLIDKVFIKLKVPFKNLSSKSIPILSIFLVIYLFFNSGLVYYLANDGSISIALNTTYDSANYNMMEVQGADWISNYGTDISVYGNNSHNGVVISDEFRQPLLIKYGLSVAPFSYYYNPSFDTMNYNIKSSNMNKTDFYFFYGTRNVLTNSIITFNTESYFAGVKGIYRNTENFSISRIYDNNGAQIYYEML